MKDLLTNTHFYVLQVSPVAMERSTTSDTASEKPNPSHSTGAVQMRIKNANSHHDRLSQSKSMILSDNVKVLEPVSKILLIFHVFSVLKSQSYLGCG